MRNLQACVAQTEIDLSIERAGKKSASEATNIAENGRRHGCTRPLKFFDTIDKLNKMEVEINADLLTIMLLYSLPPSFDNFRCAIESRDELPNPDTLRIKIIEEYDTRRNDTREYTRCLRRRNPSDVQAKVGRTHRRSPLKTKVSRAANHSNTDVIDVDSPDTRPTVPSRRKMRMMLKQSAGKGLDEDSEEKKLGDDSRGNSRTETRSRSRGRPKILRTGNRGRPKKQYHSTICVEDTEEMTYNSSETSKKKHRRMVTSDYLRDGIHHKKRDVGNC